VSKSILVYRIGSIGDTAVALPALKLIRRSFSDANRILLTNFPGKGEAPVKSIVAEMGLFHGFLDYPLAVRDPLKLFVLHGKIRTLRADTLVYLTPRTTLTQVMRDLVFLRACSISRIIGAPTSADLRFPRYDPETRLWEPEGVRIARCLAALGDARLSDAESWSLELNDAERSAARDILHDWDGAADFIALAPGAKICAKDWTVENWAVVVSQLTRLYPGMGLAVFGGADESQRAESLASMWGGPTVNLCGKLAPRVSAATMEYARLFVGHDGGPMHLAAAVGVPIVAVFSARARPGIWFPHQPGAEILYPAAACRCQSLDTCVAGQNKCILSIAPDEIIAACHRKLNALASTSGGHEGPFLP